MAEYIEKQAALDAILREPPDAHYPSWYAERIKAPVSYTHLTLPTT